MKLKLNPGHQHKTLICIIIIATTCLIVGAQTAKNTTSNTYKVIKDKPIVIQTQAQTYNNPTLDEYRLCHSNRDSCMKTCNSGRNRTECIAECPTCPILIDQDVVVQGINDTEYRSEHMARVNTTNIIRLTNEIHNIIGNSMGNVTALNQNNIHIYQNSSSRSGGKFGLGYNQNGSCCIVVRSSSNCDAQSFSTASRCHHKRHRVCGSRCTARVLYAKRLTKCPDLDKDNCYQTVDYIPHQDVRHRQSSCQYSSRWPFVSCRGSSWRQTCDRCFQIPYIYVIQQRIPRRCTACFAQNTAGGNGFVQPQPQIMPFYNPAWQYGYMMQPVPYYPMMYPSQGGYSNDFDINEEFIPQNGWDIVLTKCRTATGTIISNCTAEGSAYAAPSDNALETQSKFETDEYNDYNDDDEDDVAGDDTEYDDFQSARRKRRQSVHHFKMHRSAYSHRGRN